jgi:hypothetical protein
MQNIVPRLLFTDVYALTHTCWSLRIAIDGRSTYWADMMAARLPLSVVSLIPDFDNSLAKRLLLASIPNFCWACWRFSNDPVSVQAQVGSAERHTLCRVCVEFTNQAPPRLGIARTCRYLIDLPPFDATTISENVRRPPRSTLYLYDDIVCLGLGENMRLRPLSAGVPYICQKAVVTATTAAVGKRRRPACVDTPYSNRCRCGVSLSTHEAIQCRLNMCVGCCKAVLRYVMKCQLHDKIEFMSRSSPNLRTTVTKRHRHQ